MALCPARPVGSTTSLGIPAKEGNHDTLREVSSRGPWHPWPLSPVASGTRFDTGLLRVTALAVLFVQTNSKKKQSKPLCSSSCTQERLKGTPNSGGEVTVTSRLTHL